jgi:DNA repair protein RecN (Recombination protein N)
MLSDLVVEGLGVIERADLTLVEGSAALTGETGAGKTLVVAAAQLLLGDRADRSLVRDGAKEARVEGRFLLPPDHPATAALETAGLIDTPEAGADAEVVVTRSIAADGKAGKARINGHLVTLTTLAEIGASMMEIAGQHEHQRIGRPEYQRSLLDAFSGNETMSLAEEVAAEVKAAARAERELDELRESQRARSREADVLAYEIKEIEAAAPVAGESEELHALAGRLEHAEEIAGGVGGAVEALRSEGGAEEAIGSAEDALRHLESKDPELGPLAARLEAARYEIADVAAELGGRVVPADPEALEAARTRLGLLSRLKRKYGATDEEVLDYLKEAKTKLDQLARSDDDLERLAAEHEAHLKKAQDAAARLTEARRSSAPLLAGSVEERLRSLALPDVRFEVALEERPLYEGGAEEISFVVAANPGEPGRPVAKSASGGELSRIALALNLVTTTGSVRTMIFDEVDAGVGGEAARAVGKALADLSREQGVQVIVVTHLPQVAAFADQHHRVIKASEGGRTVANVRQVEGDERVAELSRMLAGLPDSEVAKEHARELLDMAATGSRGSS